MTPRLETLVKIQSYFTELFLVMPSIKIAKMVLLHKTKGAARDKKCLLITFPPEPLIQIYNNFTE